MYVLPVRRIRVSLPLARVDPYKLLGVNRKMNEKEIKAAYLKLAASAHPDISGSGSTSEYIKIKEAYEEIIKNLKNKSSHRFTNRDEFQNQKFENQKYENKNHYSKPPPGTGETSQAYKNTFWDQTILKMIGEDGLKVGNRYGLNTKGSNWRQRDGHLGNLDKQPGSHGGVSEAHVAPGQSVHVENQYMADQYEKSKGEKFDIKNPMKYYSDNYKNWLRQIRKNRYN
jgi:curved DNA-binding protein CbpA